ncbi:hypothetical protein CL654_00660 [bacterium]|nr:hypothetical protein [bacterium]|tara:strand:- start:3495 stop:3764 length:270 start_codon:yes stop_codon:yes gene_type:complete
MTYRVKFLKGLLVVCVFPFFVFGLFFDECLGPIVCVIAGSMVGLVKNEFPAWGNYQKHFDHALTDRMTGVSEAFGERFDSFFTRIESPT